MADWSELKRLAEAATPGPWAINRHGAVVGGPVQQFFNGSGQSQVVMACGAEWMHEGEVLANAEFIAAANPAAVLALIADNEAIAERLRMFELIHGGRASELVSEAHALRAEVRRLKILAGEDVPPLPEEFVGPMPENCYARLRRKINEQAGAPAIPANLNGLADAAFAMTDRGEDPSDMLAMLQAGLKKARPEWSVQKARTVDAMCMTWRHDFGLDRREHDFGSCGMTDAEREALRQQMGQLFEHHVAPVIAENEALTLRVMSHEQAARYWKKRFDEDTTEAIDLLKAENERLLMQLVACGVVAMANTQESAAKARDMHPDYMSASCQDVMRAVDSEMALRAELERARTRTDNG